MADIYYSIKKGSLNRIVTLIAEYIEITAPKYNQKTRSYPDIDDVFSFTNDEGGNGFGMVVFHDNYNKDGINYDPEEVLNWLIQGKYLSTENEKRIMVNLSDEDTKEVININGEVNKKGEFHNAVHPEDSGDDYQSKEQSSIEENGVESADANACGTNAEDNTVEAIVADKDADEIDKKTTVKEVFPVSSVVEETPKIVNDEVVIQEINHAALSNQPLPQNSPSCAQSQQQSSDSFDVLFNRYAVENFDQYANKLITSRKSMSARDISASLNASSWTTGILKDTGIAIIDRLVMSTEYEFAAKVTGSDIVNQTSNAINVFKEILRDTLMTIGVYLVKQGKLSRDKLADAVNHHSIAKLREIVNNALPTSSANNYFHEAFNRTTEIINKL